MQDASHKAKYLSSVEHTHATFGSTFATVCMQEAYLHGSKWLAGALAYIEENVNRAVDFFYARIPAAEAMAPGAGYLVWVDFSRCRGLTAAELEHIFLRKAKVLPNFGAPFSETCALCVRLNVACPRTTLLDALERIAAAFADRDGAL